MTQHKEYFFQVNLVAKLRDTYPDLVVFSVPNGLALSPRARKCAVDSGMLSGVSDLCIMFPEGYTLWMELKTLDKTSKQSPTQKQFERDCIRLGHYYVVVRTTDEAIGSVEMMLKAIQEQLEQEQVDIEGVDVSVCTCNHHQESDKEGSR